MPPSTTFSAHPQETPAGIRVDLAGCLDLAVCDQLAATLQGLLSRAPAAVEVNLDGLRLMDAAGIATLIRAQRLARERGGELLVTNPHGIVRKVMVITEAMGVLSTSGPRSWGGTRLVPADGVADEVAGTVGHGEQGAGNHVGG